MLATRRRAVSVLLALVMGLLLATLTSTRAGVRLFLRGEVGPR